MPDSIITNSVIGASKRPAGRFIEVDWNADPVALGLVTAEEFAAMRQHLETLKRKEVYGLAEPKALMALAALHQWPLNPPVRRGSLRFWALVAMYEEEWAQAREGREVWPLPRSKLLPRERLGGEVFKASTSLHCHTYFPNSRRALSLAEEIGDEAWITRIRSFDRQDRRRQLLAWREKHRLAMKASLAAIAKYRAALAASPQFCAA
ncbi:hypothetical protein [Reyranella soli]|uniref:Uncharacterized protein n=1 Tax=Reyranella soli TaxID=1230389 RepID=A0A512NKM5_9HYPH|nr:hypothetical protein [Reyranella soli]GEP59500.1 hypothetical protein RSO01_66660 [Reyranella soli]